MIRRTWIARLFVVAAATGVAVAMTTSSANAGLLPVSVTVQPEAGNFRWTYSVVLPTNMQLQSGSYFTIYDFAGYKAGSASINSAGPDPSFAQNWKVTSSLLGPTPSGLFPQDNPNVPNLTFTYTGPTIPAGALTLGNFTAVSSFGTQTAGAFAAINPRAIDGIPDANLTSTFVPQGTEIPAPISSPEPATLVLAGLGMPLIGLGRYLRRKGQPAAAV
jgi:hypothetical protein